jgi:uncharacterized protein (DUF433 family)
MTGTWQANYNVVMSAFADYKYLAPDPDSSYRQFRVKERRIFARTLYSLTTGDEGRMTPEEVAADYQLPVEAVLEAIAYCESHSSEILDDLREDEVRATARQIFAGIEPGAGAS